jgi:hypothetical protein
MDADWPRKKTDAGRAADACSRFRIATEPVTRGASDCCPENAHVLKQQHVNNIVLAIRFDLIVIARHRTEVGYLLQGA